MAVSDDDDADGDVDELMGVGGDEATTNVFAAFVFDQAEAERSSRGKDEARPPRQQRRRPR